MATTALQIGEQRLLIMTVPRKDGLIDVDIYLANEEFLPYGRASMGYDIREEHAYHRALRKEAFSLNQYVKEYSTNPEFDEGEVYQRQQSTERDSDVEMGEEGEYLYRFTSSES